MGEPGPGKMQMRRIGVPDRGHHPALAVGGFEIDGFAQAPLGDDVGQAAPGPRSFERQRIDGLGPLDRTRGIRLAHDHEAHAVGVGNL